MPIWGLMQKHHQTRGIRDRTYITNAIEMCPPFPSSLPSLDSKNPGSQTWILYDVYIDSSE